MITIMELSKVLIRFINAGVVFRMMYILMQMTNSEDEVSTGKRRLINLFMAMVAVNLIYTLKNVIVGYYS